MVRCGMDYVRIGTSGLKVSRIGLGMMSYGSSRWREWVLDEDEAMPFLRAAIERGITFFDTADMYSLGRSEEILGVAIRTMARRDDVVVATKTYFPMHDGPYGRGLSRKRLFAAVEDSLRRIGTDYIDLYQIHRFDDETPADETMRALEDIVRSGRVRYIGASSMYAWQFAQLQYLARGLGTEQFIAMQNHYNLLYREEEREMIPQCRSLGVGILPWSPLARGRIARAGTAGTGETVRNRSDTLISDFYGHRSDGAILDRVAQLSLRHGVSPAQIGLAWLLQRPGVAAPIVGATREHYLDDACAALSLELSPQECLFLEEPYEPHPVTAIGTPAPPPGTGNRR